MNKPVSPKNLIPIPAFNDNYIWAITNNNHAIVIDPGAAQPVLDWLKEAQLEPSQLAAILITHHHKDHTGGIEELKQLTGATVYGPGSENIPGMDIGLSQDDTINLPAVNLQFNVIDIPGHTAGHIAYTGVLQENHLIFCGDTLFAAGCGRVFEGTATQMHASLGKIKELPPETLICCAHEYTTANIRWAQAVDPENTILQQRASDTARLRSENRPTLPSTLALELQTNPFLRTDNPAVIASAENYANQSLTTPEDVFACLRQWKNDF